MIIQWQEVLGKYYYCIIGDAGGILAMYPPEEKDEAFRVYNTMAIRRKNMEAKKK